MSEKCECGRSYDFMLTSPPKEIGNYEITKPLSRGYYGATYVVEKGRRKISRVLKVSPKQFYRDRATTFDDEIDNHFQAADGAEFIVEITDDPFEATIDFDGEKVDCYCTELEFIPGYVLNDLYAGKRDLTPELAIQIACDLIHILRELKRRELNHNDLHAGNILVQELPPSAHRADAIARNVKARAIDLGSVDSQRREGGKYKSDVQWIAHHLGVFSEILATRNSNNSDLQARVAFALKQRSLELGAPQAHQADQPLEDLILDLRTTYQNAKKRYFRGWSVPLQLSGIDAHRNAQTLESWYVPRLMVDPGERWLKEINTGGPVILTGMRGCGKTMLLRSLEAHARIVVAQELSTDASEQKRRLVDDGYLGVLASARHLGATTSVSDPNRSNEENVSNFFARLFLVYGRRICDALTHLEEAFPGSVAEDAAFQIADTLFGQLGRTNPLNSSGTLDELQTVLVRDAELWSSSQGVLELVAEPWNAFVLLAQCVQRNLQGLNNPQIVFLLDDVSTRYLKPKQIELVVSTLLVQDPSCAFKITSETQTFFLSIKSPAQVNQASDERDYSSFDLGAKVLEQLKTPSKGDEFLEKILSRRMIAIGGELAALSPKEILGDEPLNRIAKRVCEGAGMRSGSSSVYHGFSALRGVCIGDLGTSIALFQETVARAKLTQLPVPKQDQHEVFQEFCSNQLFQLNNRDGKQKSVFSLKKAALEFAEASHDELVASYRNERDRLRQITSMNVALDEGNDEQIRKLLELVDAGVFALHPRKFSNRTKNQGSDPVLQFQLSFKKILGISKQIGLSDRDRFELNGEQFLGWMNGTQGADNLRASTRRYSKSDEDEAEGTETETPVAIEEEEPIQGVLPLTPPATKIASAVTELAVPSVKFAELSAVGPIDNLIVSLGFEERCLESASRIAQATRPKNIVAIEFPIPGKLTETKALAREIGAEFQTIKSEDILDGTDVALSGRTLIDASGLTKPIIFRLVRSDFRKSGSTLAAITEPSEYLPTEAALKEAIGDGKEFFGDEGVLKLTDILSGDRLPYKLSLVDELKSDPSRNRKLCAFASAKHARLIHLIEETTFDEIDVFLQEGDTYRNAVAAKAASIATSGGEQGSVIPFEPHAPGRLLEAIFQNHYQSYYVQNSNFELALTGGKLETVLAGITGACVPLNVVHYVQPADFETNGFSSGTGETTVLHFEQKLSL